MTRGGRAALLTATVALGGCVSTSGMKVRAIADPISALLQGDDLAVARGQLALNNVGLALEAFRKAQRARPSDPAPLVGLADCYSVMGRFDLAQSNYEAALALAPRDPKLLLGLARVFEMQGNLDRAAEARLEAQQDSALAASVASASVTVALPPARPAIAAAKPTTAARQPAPSVTVELPPARPVETPVQLASAVPPAPLVTPVVAAQASPSVAEVVDLAVPPRAPQRDLSVEVPMAAATAELVVATKVPLLQQAQAITLDEPARAAQDTPVAKAQTPRPPHLEMTVADVAPRALTKVQAAELSSLAPESAMDVPPPAPEPREQPKPVTDVLPAQSGSPRLVRLSPGEVALVTTAQPTLSGKAGAKSTKLASVATVRWVPLSQPGRAPNVQVLNAARSQGIAASARTILTDRGWRRIAIGDAPTVRQTSVVLYPKERAKLGRSLARQFGIKARMVPGKALVVLLGRDKVGTIKAQRNA
jgi:hypothetical protein